jgi:hypothetical protein
MPFSDSGHGPVTIAMMTNVLEAAWSEAQGRGLVSINDDARRSLMAAAILTEVKRGVRDERRLREVALDALR